MRPAAAILAAAVAIAFAPAAMAGTENCASGVCRITLSPDQLLDRASALVAENRFVEAEPMVAALAQLPAYAIQTRFLTGYMALQSGNLDRAITQFRSILNDDPGQTRVRLELARAYLMQG